MFICSPPVHSIIIIPVVSVADVVATVLTVLSVGVIKGVDVVGLAHIDELLR